MNFNFKVVVGCGKSLFCMNYIITIKALLSQGVGLLNYRPSEGDGGGVLEREDSYQSNCSVI